MFVCDLDGRIYEANDAFLSMVGYDQKDLAAGRLRWTDMTPAEWQHCDDKAIGELRTSGKTSLPYEKEYVRKDGSRVPVLIGGARFEGSPQGVAFVLDLSDRKRVDAERLKLEERLRQAERVEAIGTFAGGIAHDFNNILGAILGYGELAQKKVGEGNGIEQELDQVMQAGQRGKRLVEQILAFSRTSAGHRVPCTCSRSSPRPWPCWRPRCRRPCTSGRRSMPVMRRLWAMPRSCTRWP